MRIFFCCFFSLGNIKQHLGKLVHPSTTSDVDLSGGVEFETSTGLHRLRLLARQEIHCSNTARLENTDIFYQCFRSKTDDFNMSTAMAPVPPVWACGKNLHPQCWVLNEAPVRTTAMRSEKQWQGLREKSSGAASAQNPKVTLRRCSLCSSESSSKEEKMPEEATGSGGGARWCQNGWIEKSARCLLQGASNFGLVIKEGKKGHWDRNYDENEM